MQRSDSETVTYSITKYCGLHMVKFCGRCPNCQKTFTDLEVGQLMDPGTLQLLCTFCQGEVVEDESSLPEKDARTSLARFNEQIQPIYELLQECEEIKLAPALLEPEPTDIRKLTRCVLTLLVSFCSSQNTLT